MIRSLSEILRTCGPEIRRRLWLLLGIGALAGIIGFVSVTPATAELLISYGGYYYVLALFVLSVVLAWRVAAARRTVWRGWLRRPGVAGVVLAVAVGCTIWIDPLKHKVLFDEFVLQSTAYHMHATKEIGTVVRAYDISGTWVPLGIFLDKRPYFFTFLVSLLHDLTGYRTANMFVVNLALTPIFLALVYWLGVTLTGKRTSGYLAVGLLATMPLLGQQATGAGMELHNLTVLAGVMVLAVLYLRAPDNDRLSLLVCGAALLSQCRYESVVFVVPVALVIAWGWVRARCVLLPWPAVIAPLLLVPYAWHNRVLSAKPALWQLREGETSRFSFSYLAQNLQGAQKFFFNRDVDLANSWWLSVLGVAALVWLTGLAVRWALNLGRRTLTPTELVTLLFGLGIVGNLTMLMFYYWSRLDEVIASRFALPLYFLLALLGARLASDLDARGRRGTRAAAWGLALWFFIFGVPAAARRPYTDQNLVMQEVDWTRDVVRSREGPTLLITNTSTIPFVLDHIPTVLLGAARAQSERIRYHVSQGTFREVIVTQAIRPLSANGGAGVDPDDALPPTFHLETIVQKRFGGRWLRMSRVLAIDAVPTSGPVPEVVETGPVRLDSPVSHE